MAAAPLARYATRPDACPPPSAVARDTPAAIQRRLPLTLGAHVYTRFPTDRAAGACSTRTFVQSASSSSALAGTLRTWLDTWAGVGRIIEGMARASYDIQLTRYGERGWRATFHRAGLEHSPTRAAGSAWQPTPWRAVQAAALQTLIRADAA